MSFLKCLKGKVDAKLLTKSQADKLQKQFEELKKEYSKNMSDVDAATLAAEKLVAVESERLAQSKRNTINHALMQDEIFQGLKKRVSDRLAENKKAGGRTLLGQRRELTPEELKKTEADIWRKEGADLMERAHFRTETVFHSVLQDLNEFGDKFRSTFVGIKQNSEGITDVIKEMLGEGTGNNEASRIAKSLRGAFDNLHADYKRAGGIIGTLDNYFPQVHNSFEIKKVSKAEWMEFIKPRLSKTKMIDPETGVRFTDSQLDGILDRSYERITTKGLSDIKKMADKGEVSHAIGGEISGTRDHSRFFHFENAQAFMEYNERFGVPQNQLFDAMVSTMRSKARDIGVMEVLGPKPNAMYKFVDFQLRANGVSERARAWIKGMHQIATGYVNTSADDHWAFRLAGNLRNLFSAAYLGSASISALSDTAFIAQTAKLNGLSSTGAMKRYLAQLTPGLKADQKQAKVSAYIADTMMGSSMADARWSGENFGGKLTTNLAGIVNRASGLHIMTKAAGDAIALEFEANMGRLVTDQIPFSKLDDGLRRKLKEFDVTEKDWASVLKTKTKSPEKGIDFLMSRDIAEIDLKAARKIQDVIFNLRALATNEPSLRTRSITTGLAMGQANSIATMGFQFKSFPITLMFNHLLPMFERTLTNNERLNRAFFTLGMTTVIGGLSVQLKEIVKGKDPKPFDQKFWFAAAMQGGGLGFFGDFLFSDQSRYGTNAIGSFLGGPLGGFLDNTLQATKGNIDRLNAPGSKRKSKDVMRDIFRLAKRNTPFQNLWYTRLATERLWFDQIEKMIDRDFNKRSARLERRQMKETGQQFWWRKGKLKPRRAPKLSKSPKRK